MLRIKVRQVHPAEGKGWWPFVKDRDGLWWGYCNWAEYQMTGFSFLNPISVIECLVAWVRFCVPFKMRELLAPKKEG